MISGYASTTTDTNRDLDGYIVRDPSSRLFACTQCNRFTHRSRSNVRNHLESKHFPGRYQYSCDVCGAVVNTRRALEVHRSAYHRS